MILLTILLSPILAFFPFNNWDVKEKVQDRAQYGHVILEKDNQRVFVTYKPLVSEDETAFARMRNIMQEEDAPGTLWRLYAAENEQNLVFEKLGSDAEELIVIAGNAHGWYEARLQAKQITDQEKQAFLKELRMSS